MRPGGTRQRLTLHLASETVSSNRLFKEPASGVVRATAHELAEADEGVTVQSAQARQPTETQPGRQQMLPEVAPVPPPHNEYVLFAAVPGHGCSSSPQPAGQEMEISKAVGLPSPCTVARTTNTGQPS